MNYMINDVEKNYWMNRLKDFHECTKINFNSEKSQDKLKEEVLTITGEAYNKLIKISKGNNMALYILILSMVEIIVSRYNNNQHVCLVSPIYDKEKVTSNNVVVIPNKLENEFTFAELIQSTKKAVIDSYKHEFFDINSLIKSVKKNSISDITEIGCSLRNIHDSSYLNNMKLNLILDFQLHNNSIMCSLKYRNIDSEFVNEFFNELITCINCIKGSNTYIKDIDIVSNQEKLKIINEFNNTKRTYPSDKCVKELFEKIVDENMDKTAIQSGGKVISYCQLNEKANQVANYLRNIGVSARDFVSIVCDRSIDTIIGIIGIIKAGAAYVPVNEDYPQSRINYIINDSKTKVIIGKREVLNKFDFTELDIKEVEIENGEIWRQDKKNLTILNSSNDLIYIIYTSGSTGRPKGVCVNNRNVVRLVKNQNYITFNENDKILQTGSVAFDASTFELWGTFLNGLTICEEQKDLILNIKKLKNYIKNNNVTIMFMTTALFHQISSIEASVFNYLRTVIVGGDALNAAQYNRFRECNKYTTFVNAYGPTENTTFSTTFLLDKNQIWNFNRTIPIGKPISNSTTYVMDCNGKMLPVGVPGELYVGGDGVAEGYLNRDNLTRNKFIENPYVKGETVYKTGDLVKWLKDGNIEFIGRIDNQVKIRGFRIELGEIETEILKNSFIKEVAVIVKKDNQGEKYLCAYFSGELEPKEIKEYLGKTLPEYMIPVYMIKMDKLPLNFNGKVDKDKLPEPDKVITLNKYVKPTNEIQEKMCIIWSEVLGFDEVGIEDNFYNMGGDSIKAIQIVSRLKSLNIKVEIKDILEYRTISEISKYAQIDKTTIPQDEVEGNIILTPIMKKFIGLNKDNMNHFNQSMILFSKSSFDEKSVKKAIEILVKHHDALRIVAKNTRDFELFNKKMNPNVFSLDIFDMRNDINFKKSIDEKAEELQESINVKDGKLVSVAIFRCSIGDYLLFIINHLLVDGVSWRIIVEDFKKTYEAILSGEKNDIGLKTTSFLKWSQKQDEYADSKELMRELEYWKKLKQIKVEKINKDTVRQISSIGDMKKKEIIISKDITKQLLINTNRAFNTEINDILLSILAISIKEWKGINNVAVSLEGHGRENILKGIDITRTVGWFTSCYPIILNMQDNDIEKIIKVNKEMLRKVPNKGIGYGILRYLRSYDINIETEVSFNYLGVISSNTNYSSDDIVIASDITTGKDIGDDFNFNEGLQINSLIEDDNIKFNISFDSKQYGEIDIDKFVEIYRKNIYKVIDICSKKATTELTPSDYGVNDYTIDEFEKLENYINKEMGQDVVIQKVNKLNPLQEGMYLYYLQNPKTTGYVIQMDIDSYGKLNLDSFNKAYKMLIEKYEVLRTNIYNNSNHSVQVISDGKEYNVNIHDFTEKNNKDEELEILKRRIVDNGFDLTKDNLFKIDVIKLDDKYNKVLITTHHIILDGWSVGILVKELFNSYEKINKSEDIIPICENDYSKYLKWLFSKKTEGGYEYWRKYLNGYVMAGELPRLRNSSSEYKLGIAYSEFNSSLTEKLQNIAKNNQVTMNAICKFAFGILLQKYLNSKDVVFGSIVSGRSPEVTGIEKMVGLFVNTIPSRIISKEEYTISEMIKEINYLDIKSKNYEYLSLAQIQEQSDAKQNLIQYLMAFENFPIDEEEESSSIKYNVNGGREETNYNLNLSFILEDKLKLKIMYNSNVYDKKLIDTMISQLELIFNDVVKNDKSLVSDISIITKEDERKILNEFNNTKVKFPSEKHVIDLFEEIVRNKPDNIAIVYKDKKMTYRELNEKANAIARKLREFSVKPNEFVAICSVRSIEMIVGVIGVIKSGAAYVPIDPEYPESRIKYILEDCKPKAILNYKTKVNCGEIVQIDLDSKDLYIGDVRNLEKINTVNDLVYSIYTSGTTGNPKGVLIENKGLVNLAYDYIKDFNITEKDKILQFFNIAFDGSVGDIFMTLLKGASLYVIDKEIQLDKKKMQDYIKNLTVLFLTPQYFKEIDIENKRLIITAGAESDRDIVMKALESGADYVNAYGPTETTVCATKWKCSGKDEILDKIPIGKAISNKQVYILQGDKLCGINIPGEICIAGEGIAREYLNKPDSTKKKFVKNPYGEGRIYRTGDLGRWHSNGNIEFLGRIDNQIKVRGFRIELGEIEKNLLMIEGIDTAVALLKGDKGSQYLCAYYASKTEYTATKLKMLLKEKIPTYMIPSYFIKIDKVPLTGNGKIDKKALEKMDIDININSIKKEAPITDTQKKILDIWIQVIGTTNIGIDDNFFEIGGHSLKAIRLITKMQEANYDVDINTLFKNQTIKSLANEIENRNNVELLKNSSEIEQLLMEKLGVKSKVVVTKNKEENIIILVINNLNSTLYNDVIKVLNKFVENEALPNYIVDESGYINLLRKDDTKNKVESYRKLMLKDMKLFRESLKRDNGRDIPMTNTDKKSVYEKELNHSLCAVTFNEYVDINKLKKAIIYTIQTFDVLRRTIVKKDNNFSWKQFNKEVVENIFIPIIDLTSEGLFDREKIEQQMLNECFIEEYKLNELLYRVLLVKKSLKEFVLYIPINHMIFDGTSGNIIKSTIKQYYEELIKNEEVNKLREVTSFEKYEKQVQNGPVKTNENEIIKVYNLQEYSDSCEVINKNISKRNNKYDQFTVKIPMDEREMKVFKNNDFGISCEVARRFMYNYLDVNKLPLKVISYGRMYEEKNFYNTLGKCIDNIPILIKQKDINSYYKDVRELIHYSEEHNINFTHIANKDVINEDYSKICSLLRVFADEKRQCNVILNLLGENNTENLNMKSELVDFVKDRNSTALISKSIAFTVSYTDNYLLIECYTFIFDEIVKLKEFISQQFKQIIAESAVEK